MTRKELYELYIKVHQSIGEKYGWNCKSTCQEMTFNTEQCFDKGHEQKPFYFIKCGTYCIGDGNWEVIGSGKTEQIAIEKAAKYLKDCK